MVPLHPLLLGEHSAQVAETQKPELQSAGALQSSPRSQPPQLTSMPEHASRLVQLPPLEQRCATPLWHCSSPGSQATQRPVEGRQWGAVPEHTACATHAPPVHTSGRLPSQRRRPSSHPQLKFRSSRQTGVSPVQLVEEPQLPSLAQAWAVSASTQRRCPTSGSQATHIPCRHSGVVFVQLVSVCHAPLSLQLWIVSPLHCWSPSLHLPHALVVSRHAGVSPLQVSSVPQEEPSALQTSSTVFEQRLSPGAHSTQAPS